VVEELRAERGPWGGYQVLENRELSLGRGGSVDIPLGAMHRVERFEDDFGRA